MTGDRDIGDGSSSSSGCRGNGSYNDNNSNNNDDDDDGDDIGVYQGLPNTRRAVLTHYLNYTTVCREQGVYGSNLCNIVKPLHNFFCGRYGIGFYIPTSTSTSYPSPSPPPLSSSPPPPPPPSLSASVVVLLLLLQLLVACEYCQLGSWMQVLLGYQAQP